MHDTRKPKLLIVGGSSLLALNLVSQFIADFEVYLGSHIRNISLKGIDTIPLNFDNSSKFWLSLDSIRPDLIVNCIGLTNIELCERDPSLAFFCNSEMACWQAEYAKRTGIDFVHISTDHLFDGKQSYYSEEAVKSPLNQYAISKSQGEDRVLEAYAASLVLRTNFFAWGTTYRESFSDFIIRSLRAKTPIKLFNDVLFTPVNAVSIAEYIVGLKAIGKRGVYNAATSKRISKYEFGIALAHRFGLNVDLIIPDKIQKREKLVNRPLDMSLDNQKLSSALGGRQVTLEKEIDRLFYDEHSAWCREVKEK